MWRRPISRITWAHDRCLISSLTHTHSERTQVVIAASLATQRRKYSRAKRKSTTFVVIDRFWREINETAAGRADYKPQLRQCLPSYRLQFLGSLCALKDCRETNQNYFENTKTFGTGHLCNLATRRIGLQWIFRCSHFKFQTPLILHSGQSCGNAISL